MEVLPFDIKTTIKKRSQESLLSDVVKIMEEQKDHKIAQRLDEYMRERDSFIKDHTGKYIVILENGSLTVVEEADINAQFEDAPGKRYGIVMKIGEEVKDSNAMGFYADSFPKATRYAMPITFMVPGMSHTKRFATNAIVDTGCEITVFSNDVFDFIRSQGTYKTTSNTMQVIGGQIAVKKGRLTIEFCGRLYEDMDVYFAAIPYVALIGMDLLGNGKLDVDIGQRISFTYH